MTAIDIPESMLYGVEPARRPGEFFRDDRGTPMVADPVKVRKDGKPWTVKYGRPSSFGKQIENTYNLDKWNERQIVLGVAHGVDCSDLIPAHQDDKEWRSRADGLVVAAKREAKAMLAAERGTHTHLTTELDDEGKHWLVQAEAGEELGIPIDVQTRLVEAWRRMLSDLHLEIVANEATVVNDRWRLAGTLDRIARLTRDLVFTTAGGEIVTLAAGSTIVLDIKTGKNTQDGSGYPMFWHTYAVQVCAYADAVPYNPDTGERGTWEVQPHSEWAIIAHLDVLAALEGEAVCTPILVDIRAGREAGDLCLAAKNWQKRNDLFGRLHAVAEVPDSRSALRARIAELIAAGHEDRLRAAWPHGVAPLSRDGHTDADLTLILTAVRLVESDVSWPFRPEDVGPTPTRKDTACDTPSTSTDPTPSSTSLTTSSPPPPTSTSSLTTNSTTSPAPSSVSATSTQKTTSTDDEKSSGSPSNTGTPPTPSSPNSDDTPQSAAVVGDESPPRPAPQLPDEGGDVDPASLTALQAAFAALPDEAKAAIAAISAEANAAGRSISVTANPTVRRWSIARALVAWARSDLDGLGLWSYVAEIATREQTADADQTLGALLGTFTIEQANSLHDALSHTAAA